MPAFTLDPDEIIKSILALIFVGVGLLFSFLLGQVSTLTCNRVADADRCVLRVNWMGISPLKETHIEGLLGAQVEENCDDDCVYRVVLVTARQTLPLEQGYTSDRQEKQLMAQRINTFAKDRQIVNLEETVGGGFWLVIPLVFIAAGVYLALKPLSHALRGLFPHQS